MLKDNANIGIIFLIIPITAALFEPQDVCKRGCVRGYQEAVRLPLSRGNPLYGDVETVEVILRADLGCGDLHRLYIEAGTCIDGHLRRKLQVAARAESLGDVVLEGLELRVETLAAAERIAEVQRPRRVRVRVIEPSSRDVFSCDRVVVDTLVCVRSALGSATSAAFRVPAVVSRPCFMRLPPDIFRPKSLPLLYTFIQFLSCFVERNPYFAEIFRSDPLPSKYSLTAASFTSSV